MSKIVLGALLTSMILAGCTSRKIEQPTLTVTTIPQPSFNILKVYAESPVVRIPPQEQTVVCNGCDLTDAGLKQEDDVIWIRLVPSPPAQQPEETIIDARHFDFDRAILKGDLSKLDLIAQKLKQNPEISTNIVGHTDSKGSRAYNQKLGSKRAQAVKRWLVAQGIDANRIATSSMGETQPLATNKTKAGRATNRRAVITIHVAG